VNTCLITNDVKRLVEFYEPILALKAKRTGEDYAEFPTGVGVLAVFSEDAHEKYIPGSAEAAKNKSVVLQFRVGDVDQEYRRLQGLVKTWVKPPTTPALGNPVHLLPRPGWKSCRFLRADHGSIANREAVVVNRFSMTVFVTIKHEKSPRLAASVSIACGPFQGSRSAWHRMRGGAKTQGDRLTVHAIPF
jgi:hypothetical protein